MAGAGHVSAQERPCPAGGIKLLVPFAVGSINDTLARAVAQPMAELLGQPMVVENRLGAGGSISTAAVLKAPPDGCTLGLATSSQMVANVGLYPNLPFDVDRDVAWVGLIARTQLVLVAGAKSPATLQALLADANQRPDALTYGSGGPGSISHILAEAFVRQAGIQARHVPYKGNAPALADVAGGHIDLLFDPLATSAPLAQQGRVRLLAISGEQRSPQAPTLPTFGEQGLAGYEAYTWNGLIAPAATPAPVLQRLNTALGKALADPAVARQIAQGGSERIGPSTPEAAQRFARQERERWVPLIRAMKIAVE